MPSSEIQVVLARIDGLQGAVETLRADLLRIDERQRAAAESLARLEATSGSGQSKDKDGHGQHNLALTTKAQAGATAGLVAVMLALVEVIRMLTVGG